MNIQLPSGKSVEAADVADALGLPSPDLVEKDYYVVRATPFHRMPSEDG